MREIEREGGERERVREREREREGGRALAYLGLTLVEDAELDAEVTRRVQSGGKYWKGVSGELCDRKIKVKIKGKVYMTLIRQTLVHRAETWALKKAQQN